MNSDNNSTEYAFEGFRLTFEHFMNINGEKIRLEEPLIVQNYFDRSSYWIGNSAKSYALNEILERMKEEIYKRALNEMGDWNK